VTGDGEGDYELLRLETAAVVYSNPEMIDVRRTR
jgi:hypothetical protein